MIFWSGLKWHRNEQPPRVTEAITVSGCRCLLFLSDAVSDVEMQEHYDEFFEVGGLSLKVMLK